MNFEYLLNSTDQSAKPTDLKIIFFLPSNNVQFSFLIPYTANAFIYMVEILFSQEKCHKTCLKINWFVKTPLHRPSVGVARSGL